MSAWCGRGRCARSPRSTTDGSHDSSCMRGDESMPKELRGGALSALMLRHAADEIIASGDEQETAGFAPVRLCDKDRRRFEKRLNRLVADLQRADDPDRRAPRPRLRALPREGRAASRERPCVASGRRAVSGGTPTSSGCGRPRRSACSARRWVGIAIPLVAILVLDASAFEVAALGTVLFLPFIFFTLPAGVWVDRLPRRPILIVGDFGRAALLATVPIAYVADGLTLVHSIRRRVPRRRTSRSSSTSRTRRTSRRSSSATRSSRELEARDQPLGLADRWPRSGRDPRRDPHGTVRRARRRAQLPRLGPLPPPHPEGRATPGGEGRRRAEGQPLDGSEGGTAFRPRQPQPPRAGGCTATSNFFANVASRPCSCSPCVSSASRPVRSGSSSRSAAVGSLAAAFTATRISRPLRNRPDLDRRGIALRPGKLLVALAPAGNAAIPILVLSQLVLRLHARRLQHRPGELPAGDLPAAPPGADELGDAVHRLGHDPVRRPPWRCARDVGRAPRDDRHRRCSAADSHSSGCSFRRSGTCARCPSRSTTPSPSPQPPNLQASCPNCPRSKPGCASSTRSSPARRSRRRARRTSRRSRRSRLRSRSSTDGASRARAGAGRTSSSRSRATTSSFASTS